MVHSVSEISGFTSNVGKLGGVCGSGDSEDATVSLVVDAEISREVRDVR